MKEMLEGKQGGNSYVAKGTKLLETLLKQIPGFITGYLLKAKGKMALGDFNEAVGSINKVLELDPKNDLCQHPSCTDLIQEWEFYRCT